MINEIVYMGFLCIIHAVDLEIKLIVIMNWDNCCNYLIVFPNIV